MLKLFLSLLIFHVNTLNVTNFVDFELVFDTKCQEYFLFNGTNNYAYLHELNGEFELQLNQSETNYSTYIGEINDTAVVFTWNGFLLNNRPMELVSHEGDIQFPLQFHTETFLCDVTALKAGNRTFLNDYTWPSEVAALTYKCKSDRNWYLIALAVSVILIAALVSLTIKNGSNETLRRSSIFGILQRGDEISSRSEENSSSSYEETSI